VAQCIRILVHAVESLFGVFGKENRDRTTWILSGEEVGIDRELPKKH
jgi:hypothetical protein